MLKEIIDEISKEASGGIAKGHVEQICRFHRIQASPGYREAAKWCSETLEGYGLDAKILEYPADGKTTYWTQLMFKEWAVEEAELRIVEPKESARILARFGESKMSIIQRSSPTPPNGVEADLVVLENGEKPEEYRRVNVRGKMVLTSGEVERVRSLAVDKHGAVGIVTDRMAEFPPIRQRTDLPDALQYTSFWWQKGQKPCFGFVLSPRQGNALRRLVQSQKGKRKVRLHAKVNSRLYSGKIENVSAVIKGRTDEEVLVVAHLCHPQHSANDNASGCGALIEVARVLQKLVGEKRLPKPKRTIRFLLVPEMTGTYAYLATNKRLIPRTVAAVNLDMVGENQEFCRSSLLVEAPPQAMSSHVADLLEAILERISGDARSLGGSSSYPLFRYAVTPFSGGSDHYILSDPTVGIPCPMLIQWPDKFYHTSEDTVEKVDPGMLRRVAVLVGTYAYFLANAGYGEVLWLTNELLARFKRTIALTVQRRLSEFLDSLKAGPKSGKERAGAVERFVRELSRYVSYFAGRKVESVKAISRLVEQTRRKEFLKMVSTKASEINAIAEQEHGSAFEALRHLVPEAKAAEQMLGNGPRVTELERRAMRIVPRRRFPGPVSTRSLMARLREKDREKLRAFEKMMFERKLWVHHVLALYWTDGARNLKEISDLVCLETGKETLKELHQLFSFLEKAKLIELRKI